MSMGRVFLRSFSRQREWIQLLYFLKDPIECDSAFQLCWKLGFYSRATRPSYIKDTKEGKGRIGKEKKTMSNEQKEEASRGQRWLRLPGDARGQLPVLFLSHEAVVLETWTISSVSEKVLRDLKADKSESTTSGKVGTLLAALHIPGSGSGCQMLSHSLLQGPRSERFQQVQSGG